MRRRSRITLVLATFATIGFGAYFGLAAHEGVPSATATTPPAAVEQTVEPSQASGSIPQRSTPPRAVHARTRAS